MFTLDEKIESTSLSVGKADVFDCRLVKDDRYFWVLIIPELEGIEEIHHLSPQDASVLAQLTRHLSEAIQRATSCDKINSAAIGNVVPMLHVHVVARNAGDEAWPYPIWGRGEPKPMTKTIEQWRIAVVKDALARFSAISE